MAFLTVGKENNTDIQIYYEDRGEGRPVLLIHGWPLNGGTWEKQSAALLAAGYRVITYDRRGFGRSSAPAEGYNYDTLAGDAWKLIEHLELRDLAVAGFSMGGGEVARLLGKYDDGRITRCVFISAITPALRRDGNNPEGVDPAVFEGIKGKIEADRYDFLDTWTKNYYNHGLLSTAHSSDAVVRQTFNIAANSSYFAQLNCVDAWLEDFRDDLSGVTIPTLVIHGNSDKVIPLEAAGARMPTIIKQAELRVIDGGPHGLNWTHAVECNKILLSFLK
jgi:pimeloyl-ACP methyl ester carboxylesterase